MPKARDLLSKNIVRLRDARDWTQAELAEACDLSLKMIQKLEYGKAAPSPETLDKLSKALGEPIASFYENGRKVKEQLAPSEPNTDWRLASEFLSKFVRAPDDIRRLVLTIVLKDATYLRGASPEFRRHATAFLQAVGSL